MATLTVSANHDYRSDTLSGITEIKWTGSFKATFKPDQFDDLQIDTDVLLTSPGVGHAAIEIAWTTATGFTAANWRFSTFWDDLDEIIFRGASTSDIVIGTVHRDQFFVSGADIFYGGDSVDTFAWNGASDLATGTRIDGGSGGQDFDRIRGAGILDFMSKATTFVDVEYVSLLAGATMIFSGTQIAGFSGMFDAGSASTETLIVRGSSVSLFGVTFFDWGIEDIISIEGTAGNDSLKGNNRADRFTGGGSNDTIDGSFGADVAIYTGASASYSVTRNTNGTLRVADLRAGTPDGVDSVINVESFQFSDGAKSLGQLADITDFNVFLYNASDNDHRDWTMAGGGIGGNFDLGAAAAPWKVVATGDFDSNGISDPIWFNSATGETREWLMSSSGISTNRLLGGVPAGWKILGTGDFNGDGSSDIMWENTVNGELRDWIMVNGSVSSNLMLGNLPAEWRLVATGDFTGDGTYDIFWRNISTGEIREWGMSNGVPATNTVIGFLDGSWGIAATGDFNHDHTADMIWRNVSTGETRDWLMSNGAVSSNIALGNVTPEWNIIAAGDFNQDGHDDLMWENTSAGDLREWLMVNGVLSSSIVLGSLPADWHPSVNPAIHSNFLHVI